MKTPLASVRAVGGLERVDQALRRLEEGWARGRPDLEALWNAPEGGGSVSVLAALVKADLGFRYARGEHPAVADYLERFPDLTRDGERVLSLVYEEYCLREERGERPDAEEFCERYAPWKDSLASQLRYHRVISQVVGGPPPPVRFPMAGEAFEHFRICDELGRGGAARVYLARDESLGGREVALKISLDRGDEPSILGRLEHDHIITVLSVTDQPGTHLRGLCMPYRPGLPLDEVIRRVNPASRPKHARALWDALTAPSPGAPSTASRSPEAAAMTPPGGDRWASFPARGSYVDGVAWVVATLAEALACAHARGIFHRDVKPANVLLTARDGPQLLDFNLSHDPHSAVQAAEALRGGTLPYMAPEQLDAFLDPARWTDVVGPADLYSLGLLLRELLTGQAPETPDPSLPLSRAIRLMLDRRPDLPTDLRRVNPSVPHAMEAIVRRCLAFAPGDRYRDADALAEDLRRFLARRPLKDTPNPSKREKTANWAWRHRGRLASAAVAAAAIAAVVLQALDRFTPPEDRPAFRRAVEALDRRRPSVAINELNTLSDRDRQSPIVGYYTAAALVYTLCGSDADPRLEEVWKVPGAGAALVAWGQRHRQFVDHTEYMGTALANNIPLRKHPVRGRGMLDRAERALRLSQALEPGRELTLQSLAVIADLREDFAAAFRILTGLIGPKNHPVRDDGHERFRSLLQNRARVLTRWGQSSLKRLRAGDDRDDPSAHFAEALADLDRADTHVRTDEKGDEIDKRFDLNLIRCEITLALSEEARFRGQIGKSDRFRRQALALLGPLSAHGPDRARLYEEISDKVKRRLPSEPIREASRQADRR